MFLRCNRSQSGYDRYGSQHAGGPFLLIFGQTPGGELRAAVRSVRMKQCGHWMMGDATIAGVRLTVSGAYGGDGLPMDPAKIGGHWDSRTMTDVKTGVDPEVAWQTLIPLPAELQTAFWAGGGHNSSGSEGPAMREWAIQNQARLRKAGKL